jgi:MerR family transcriptional regulator, light-induced transcriptional regulator
MNRFSIFDLEQLTGIKAHTIRIWEQRYGILLPKREPSNHRYYDDDDLKRVLKITNLYNKGYKISQIACLTENELNIHSKKVSSHDSNNPEMLINQLLEKAMEFDDIGFNQLLNQAVTFLGQEKAIFDIFFPLLKKIGNLWLHNNLIPLQEHFASIRIRNKIISFINMQGTHIKTKNEPAILLFAPPEEEHEIPILCINYLLRKYQRKCHYIGTNANNTAIAEWVYKKQVGSLWLHCVSNLTGQTFNEYLQTLLDDFKHLTIYVSGSAAFTATLTHPNLVYLATKEDMLKIIHTENIDATLN